MNSLSYQAHELFREFVGKSSLKKRLRARKRVAMEKRRNFALAFQHMQKAIEGYGLKVWVKALPSTITGDFDGMEIFVREDLNAEMKLFILCHLFGHTVQFNISSKMRKIGLADYTARKTRSKTLQKVREYEYDASRYAVGLFHEIGMSDLDQWISDWVAADWSYLQEVYTAGRKKRLTKSFLDNFKGKYFVPGQPKLLPLTMPRFIPRKWARRFSF